MQRITETAQDFLMFIRWEFDFQENSLLFVKKDCELHFALTPN